MGGILQWEKEGSRSICQDKNAYFARGDANSKDWKPNQFDKTAVDVEFDEKPAANYQHRC